MFGKPRSDYGDHITKDIVLFRDENTDEIIGIGVYNFKKRTKDFKNIKLDLPFKVNLSEIKI